MDAKKICIYPLLVYANKYKTESTQSYPARISKN